MKIQFAARITNAIGQSFCTQWFDDVSMIPAKYTQDSGFELITRELEEHPFQAYCKANGLNPIVLANFRAFQALSK